VGDALAIELLLTGRVLDADEALAAGLVSSLHPADELLGAAHALADRIAANDPRATQLTKRVFAAPRDQHPAVDLEAQAELFESPEKQRRMTEFLEKRKK
jgi:enoyl-CoA hydratase